jgi:hypothetical protein
MRRLRGARDNREEDRLELHREWSKSRGIWRNAAKPVTNGDAARGRALSGGWRSKSIRAREQTDWDHVAKLLRWKMCDVPR